MAGPHRQDPGDHRLKAADAPEAAVIQITPGTAAGPGAPAVDPAPCIGVFDSGLGGLTVLAALHRRLPHARLLYAADSAFAPYGERGAAYVLDRSRVLTRFLVAQGAQLIVVACNTATALAIGELRAEWPGLPFVGIEPAIKPALAARAEGDGPVGVLATSATLASGRFRALLAQHGAGARVVLQACPGLVEAIETRGPQAPPTLELLRRFCQPLRDAGCTRVVLGCTHYPLLADAIRATLGDTVRLLDPADAVAAQAERLARALPAQPRGTGLQAWSNGEAALLLRVAEACALPIERVLALPQESPEAA